MDEYRISKKYLEELIKKGSRSLVGEIMKRFELFDDKEEIKKLVKELVYENYREIEALIKAFSCGVKFITKPREKE